MTQEEKARAYDEALERARKWYNNPNSSSIGKSYLYAVFPELKESEDEKISREITEFILTHRIDEPNDIEDTNLWLAWLEKQGEKAVISHKFNVGDWIISKWGGIYQIKEVMSGSYNLLCTNNAEEINSITQVDNNSRLLCIGDIKKLEEQGEQKPAVDFRAEDWCVSKVDGKIHNIYNSEVGPKFKVGDWITNGEYTWFIEGMHNRFYDIISPEGCGTDDTIIHVDGHFHLWTIQDAKDGDVLASGSSIFLFQEEYIAEKPIAYCGLMNGFFIEGKDACWTNEKCYPATKEQRDLLFQKIKEAGYEWNADKKELKKIEDEEYNGEDYGIDSLYHAQRILEKTLGKVDGYQTDDGILSHKCAITAVKKLYGQKPSWSEEDDYNLQCMIAKVDNDIQNGNVGRNQELIDWLKSIKPRMGGQQ